QHPEAGKECSRLRGACPGQVPEMAEEGEGRAEACPDRPAGRKVSGVWLRHAVSARLRLPPRSPGPKEFSLSDKGLLRKWDDLVCEAAKCVLLCKRCHAELHSGMHRDARERWAVEIPTGQVAQSVERAAENR